MFGKEEIVRNPKQPKWGLGRVLEVRGPSKLRVLFEDGKDRVLDLTLVTLELVEKGSTPARFDSSFDMLSPLPNVDMDKVRSACELFISVMEDNRPNSDDAGVARRVLDEMETRGRLTLVTYRRLAHWCHTDGSAYQRGVDIAQDISRFIFGRVISKE
jgi:hypothetical protein